MSFRTGSKWNCSCRARSRSATLTSTPSLAAAASMGTSVGSPADPSGCALLQADIVSARAETIRFGARSARSLGASRSTVCGAVQILVTVIRFSVSVPVLSVQITLVEPSVSTALSRLITAPRRTSPRTPTARARVITGSSPSGTLPTNSPTANTTASLMGNPATKVPIGMNAAPVTTAIRAISHATRRTCASSGLSSFSTRSDSAAIRPSSLCIPVANTSALASPSVHVVPEKTRSRACSGGTLPSSR